MNSTSKTQIDRLGDRLRKGKFGDEELRQLDEFRRSFAAAYDEVVSIVRKTTQLEPTGRPAKSTTSIVEKLRRETMRLTQMQDIAGCRLVVQDILKQDQVVNQLTAALPGAEVVDRRKEPSHGYRAVHVIATKEGKPVEIQVRTEFQHLWAQLSEKLSDTIDPAIKYGGGNTELQALLMTISERSAEMEKSELEILNLGPEFRNSPELGDDLEETVESLMERRQQLLKRLEEIIFRLGARSRKGTGN